MSGFGQIKTKRSTGSREDRVTGWTGVITAAFSAHGQWIEGGFHTEEEGEVMADGRLAGFGVFTCRAVWCLLPWAPATQQRAGPGLLVLFANAEHAALNPPVGLFLCVRPRGPGGWHTTLYKHTHTHTERDCSTWVLLMKVYFPNSAVWTRPKPFLYEHEFEKPVHNMKLVHVSGLLKLFYL